MVVNKVAGPMERNKKLGEAMIDKSMVNTDTLDVLEKHTKLVLESTACETGVDLHLRLRVGSTKRKPKVILPK